MAVIHTKAIILRHSTDREHDRLLTVLTPERGQLRVRARGTKKSTSKLAGSLEPVTEVELTLADGRTTDQVIGSVVLNRWQRVHDDLVASVSAQWLLELVAAVTKPGQATDTLYHRVQHHLTDMEGECDWPVRRRWLMLLKRASQVLDAEGFWPQSHQGMSPEIEAFLADGTWPRQERPAVLELHKIVEHIIHHTIDQSLRSERVLRSAMRAQLPGDRSSE